MKLRDNANLALLGTVRINLDKLFNNFCDCDVSNGMKFIKQVMDGFREEVMRYEKTDAYSYAVGYSHLLIDQLERMVYPGKVKKSNYQSFDYMSYAEFCEYLKNPNPGDMITVTDDKGGQLARVKVRTVIDK